MASSLNSSDITHTAQAFNVFGTGRAFGDAGLGLDLGLGIHVSTVPEPAPAIITPVENMRAPSESAALKDVSSYPLLTESITDELSKISLDPGSLREPKTSFIHTNESFIEETLGAIKKWQQSPADPFQTTIQLGVGSIVNYSFACASKASAVVITDLDPKLVKFHNSILNTIATHPEPDEALATKIIRRLEWNELGRRHHPAEHFDTSWITPENLRIIKDMVQQGRFQCVLANVKDAINAFEKIKTDMADQLVTPPKVLLYTSNVGDWVAGRKSRTSDQQQLETDYNQFKAQATNLVGKDGLLIFSTVNNKSEDSGLYKQQVSIGHNSMPEFTVMKPI